MHNAFADQHAFINESGSKTGRRRKLSQELSKLKMSSLNVEKVLIGNSILSLL
jgi:hypothetical protein